MKLQPISQNIKEWLGIKLGLVPVPVAWSHFGFMAAKFLLEAVDKGVFEVIGSKQLTTQEIAEDCQLNEAAVKSLLPVLATMGLLREKGGKIFLMPPAKKWLLKDSPSSLYWLMIFDNRVCYKWMDKTGAFLQTGKGLQYHETFTGEEWFYYQKAMEAVAGNAANEAAKKLPLPAGTVSMLDIGGAHGLYAVALCNKYPRLSSTILDLPAAVAHAAPIVAGYGLGNRIQHLAGNVLTDDLGHSKYDFILMANVAHHFTAEENERVAHKVYEALKPGGIFTIMEVLKKDAIVYKGDMLAALGDMFFALSSTSGLYSLSQIKEWQTVAGFTFYKKSGLISIPGYVAVSAVKMR